MQSSRHIIFRSSKFNVEPGEDEDTNPGVYGKSLAEWLAVRLEESGRSVHGCIAEDFGRLVHVAHPTLRLYVACANGHDFPDQWQLFTIAESGGLASLLVSRPKRFAADELMAEVERIFRTEPSISDIAMLNGSQA